tara:strand:+ start:275 stop:469 length:195 start_codon:yes stop_codon:yes gene_type:complete
MCIPVFIQVTTMSIIKRPLKIMIKPLGSRGAKDEEENNNIKIAESKKTMLTVRILKLTTSILIR